MYPLLNNHPFLKSAYIQARSNAKSSLAAQQVGHSKAIASIKSIDNSSVPSSTDTAINIILNTVNEHANLDFQEDQVHQLLPEPISGRHPN